MTDAYRELLSDRPVHTKGIILVVDPAGAASLLAHKQHIECAARDIDAEQMGDDFGHDVGVKELPGECVPNPRQASRGTQKRFVFVNRKDVAHRERRA